MDKYLKPPILLSPHLDFQRATANSGKSGRVALSGIALGDMDLWPENANSSFLTTPSAGSILY